MNTRPTRYNGPSISEVKVDSTLKNIWENGVNIKIMTTTTFVFSAKITFKTNGGRSFPAEYKMNLYAELIIQYAPNCKICHRHDHTLSKCPFKGI